MSDALSILLGMEPPGPETKEIEVIRLSRLAKSKVVFKIRSIGYSRAADIKKMSEEQDIQILLAGVVVPNLKDESLQRKYGAATPAELVKNLLQPGEIEEISREIQRLSGYLTRTITEIKKK